jgi:secretion/DNA translocation related TadE-like protein
MQKTTPQKANDSGQVTILLLVLALVLLSALPIVGSIGQLLVTQQRLNAAADASALAGALELEFNQPQACDVARNFQVNFPSSTMSCEASNSRIRLVLTLPITNAPMKYLFPNLVATASAGIAQPAPEHGID